MAVDALDHMEEAWNLVGNPFPAEAVHARTRPIVQPSSMRRPRVPSETHPRLR